uniref:Gag-pol polyprotein n=1 Tax=Solanum tuberosum TaxID=4113 RepID=M1DH66_SOLTU
MSEMVVKECRTTMLINDMDMSHIMVHDQSIEGEKFKEKTRQTKRAKTDDGNFSHARSDGHGRPRFRQTFSGQGSSNASPKFNKERVSNHKPQGGNESQSSLPMSTCVRCGKKHEGREGKQAPPSGAGSNTPKKNQFYAVQTRGEQEGSPDVVTDAGNQDQHPAHR